jgi:hypothetical protein
MLEHVWSVLCRSGSVDEASHSISLFNVIETIGINEKAFGEVKHIDLKSEIVSLFSRSADCIPCKGKVKYELIKPDGALSSTVDFDIDLVSSQFHRLRLFGQNFPVDQKGIYIYKVSLLNEGKKEWQTVAKIPINVVVVSEEKIKPVIKKNRSKLN